MRARVPSIIAFGLLASFTSMLIACKDRAPSTAAPPPAASASAAHSEPEPDPGRPDQAPPQPVEAPALPTTTPESTLAKRKVSVRANGHWACSTKEAQNDAVTATPEPHGARISIAGQGPCPGEIREWNAAASAERIDVNGTHGAAARCKCVGDGDMVLTGLDPGTYDVHVNGGFDRPIAVRVTVTR